MKYLAPFFLFAASLFGASLSIIEAPHFQELKAHVSPGSLLLLDIDDTLLVPTQMLGTDVWFNYQWNKNKQEPDPLDKTLAEWEAIRHLTQMKIVEPGAQEIVAELQQEPCYVMGLTTQGLALATRTINQLLTQQIDLSQTAPSLQDHYFLNGHGVLYRKGVLFTSGTPKGPALKKFLEIIQIHPKKIVFINDKKTHLLDVAAAAQELNIDFVGLRYSYSDERVEQFCPELAEIQFHHSTFSHILSDEEARSLLSHEPS